MDDPVSEIESVILSLTTTPPSVQAAAIDKYFTPSAVFVHPFCRTSISPSSRYQLTRIYRWYKIMSPKISMKVHSVAFDRSNNVLYVGITQVFAIWLVPFHRSEVSLVTVLHLEHRNDRLGLAVGAGTGAESGESSVVNLDLDASGAGAGGKWYITSQNDLYQTDQFMRFLVPQLAWMVEVWQVIATWVCVVCSYLFEPVTWWEETQQTKFQRVERPPAWNDGKGNKGLHL
ncbi:hypothetical protein C1H76_7211 [Elsinoe australis]|uniref:SigF-like NTF2-like domain-containing protein n=1 Tax=Elsinoe australis TaxID=40998 RepID=A0A4U7AUU0_9PEZI|nr:hypothetical protein C1H76_7211 [Elsinoe australis]